MRRVGGRGRRGGREEVEVKERGETTARQSLKEFPS